MPSSRAAGAALLFLISMPSCVGDDPAPTPPGGGTQTGTPGTPDAGTTPSKTKRFVGTWSTPNGTQSVSDCGLVIPPDTGPFTLTLTEGATSDLVVTNSIAVNCALKLAVDGDAAKLAGAQACQAVFQEGTDTYTYAPTTGFILGPDGLHGTMTYDATVTSTGGPGSCTFKQTAAFTKQ
jgi:hypothetical protein